jgi:hypothetical protein
VATPFTFHRYTGNWQGSFDRETILERVKIADEVEEEIRSMRLRFLSGPLIRELVSVKLLEHGFDKARNVYTRVGMPLYDVYSIDNSEGYEAKENANLQANPETFHKKKADFLSKESYLLMIPPNVADAHLKGDIPQGGESTEIFGGPTNFQDGHISPLSIPSLKSLKGAKIEAQYVLRNNVNKTTGHHKSRIDHCSNNDDKDQYEPCQIARFRSWENVLKELSKCEVLCSNCHRIEHFKE